MVSSWSNPKPCLPAAGRISGFVSGLPCSALCFDSSSVVGLEFGCSNRSIGQGKYEVTGDREAVDVFPMTTLKQRSHIDCQNHCFLWLLSFGSFF